MSSQAAQHPSAFAAIHLTRDGTDSEEGGDGSDVVDGSDDQSGDTAGGSDPCPAGSADSCDDHGGAGAPDEPDALGARIGTHTA